jgi:hypothetical protein
MVRTLWWDSVMGDSPVMKLPYDSPGDGSPSVTPCVEAPCDSCDGSL